VCKCRVLGRDQQVRDGTLSQAAKEEGIVTDPIVTVEERRFSAALGD